MDKDYIKSIQEYIVSSYREFEIIYSISNTQKYKRLSLYFEEYDIEIKIKWDIGTENLQVRFKSNSENENLQYEDSMSNIEACADLNSLITTALPNDKLREVLQSKNCKTLVKFYILYGNKPTNEIDYITTVSTAPEDKLTKFYIEHNTDTLIKKLAKDQKLSAKLVAKAAAKGDQKALDIFAKAGYYLGIGIANLVNIFNPEMIILGGGVLKAKEYFLDRAKEEFKKRALKAPADIVKIKEAVLEDEIGVKGAIALAMQKVEG